jgi:hypothetical protein
MERSTARRCKAEPEKKKYSNGIRKLLDKKIKYA